jgi:hypothetical protein
MYVVQSNAQSQASAVTAASFDTKFLKEAKTMYTPQLGAFLTRDPLPEMGEPDLLYDNNSFGRQLDVMRNRYGYVSENPLRNVDPFGLLDCDCANYCFAYIFGLEGLLATGSAAGVGAAAQAFNKSGAKPRVGLSGGGPSGGFTSRSRRILGKPLGKAIGRASLKTAAATCASIFTVTEYLLCYAACEANCGGSSTTRSPDDLTAGFSGNISPPMSFTPSGSILGP